VKREELKFSICRAKGTTKHFPACGRVVASRRSSSANVHAPNGLERPAGEGDSPVCRRVAAAQERPFDESGCLRLQSKVGGKLLLKLNTGERPIAKKYREGKMKSTLKRE